MDKNTKTGLSVLAIVIFMVGLAFASVPLYDLFCRVTGFGGTTQVSDSAPLPEEIRSRVVTVRFNTDTHRDLPWSFKPEENKVDVYVGAQRLIAYKTKNETSRILTGTAVYNVSPLKAGKYFHKTQCFCFNEQALQPGEEMTMPVVFYIDPAFDDDPNMDDVQTITLSYTFFGSETYALDQALEDFYNTN